jgi:hypothetical protein
MKFESVRTAADLAMLIEAGYCFRKLKEGDTARLRKKLEKLLADKDELKKLRTSIWYAADFLSELRSMPCAVHLGEVDNAGAEGQ